MKNSFIESNILGDIYSTIGGKTFVAFMERTITKESTRERFVLKFVTIVRLNVRETLTTKELELKSS